MEHAELFTAVLKAQYDDRFTGELLGGKHYCRVSVVRTVLPNDAAALEVLDGGHPVTLITCTLVGANGHRMLVTCTRILNEQKGGEE